MAGDVYVCNDIQAKILQSSTGLHRVFPGLHRVFPYSVPHWVMWRWRITIKINYRIFRSWHCHSSPVCCCYWPHPQCQRSKWRRIQPILCHNTKYYLITANFDIVITCAKYSWYYRLPWGWSLIKCKPLQLASVCVRVCMHACLLHMCEYSVARWYTPMIVYGTSGRIKNC